MPMPLGPWGPGSWDHQLEHFERIGEMIGLGPNPDDQQLYRAIGDTSSPKAFQENVKPFLQRTGMTLEQLTAQVHAVERDLGLLGVLPFMSYKRGLVDPAAFKGVGFWATGTAGWTDLRLEALLAGEKAGATFEYIICFWSTRKCDTPADKKHPKVKMFRDDHEPTEEVLQKLLVPSGREKWFRFVELPELNAAGKPLSLEQQIEHAQATGQLDELIGQRPVFMGQNGNATYNALQVPRLAGLADMHFMQADMSLIDDLPAHFAPTLQWSATYVNGAFRFWKELRQAGCISA